jgi:hypothetical protein
MTSFEGIHPDTSPGVDVKLDDLLQRVEGLRRTSTLKPKTFTEQAYRDATAQSQVPENGTWTGETGGLGGLGSSAGGGGQYGVAASKRQLFTHDVGPQGGRSSAN